MKYGVKAAAFVRFASRTYTFLSNFFEMKSDAVIVVPFRSEIVLCSAIPYINKTFNAMDLDFFAEGTANLLLLKIEFFAKRSVTFDVNLVSLISKFFTRCVDRYETQAMVGFEFLIL
jgi:hypothetical protein